MFVEWCFREKRGKIKSRIQEEWSQAASRYAPTQKRRILSASSACERKSLFNKGLFNRNGQRDCVSARKVVDFQGLLLGAFFVPVFGPGLLTCAKPSCPGLTPIICVRLGRWSPTMNSKWCLIKSRIQEEWSQAASRYAPTQKRRIQYPPLLRVGKQKARKSLFKSCQAPRRVEPSEDAFSTEAWCPNGHGFWCLCG